ncbi:sce7725 family protein [Pseudomonas syringae]|uniref:sce7725 family protein n=1 Tax=Pseudomonas syringae TaxID=317 RepID=UPI000E326FEC|nr:sce7725 family protein [Pseudomonas syringae]
MYYPILKAKRHELNTLFDLASVLPTHKYCPVIEPVNIDTKELIGTIEQLKKYNVRPIVVINPNQGKFSKAITPNLFPTLQANPKSANNFTPCIKVRDSKDLAALSLLTLNPTFAVYLESEIDYTSVPALKNAHCVLLNPQKVDPGVIKLLKNIVVYQDSFAKKKRNADYGSSSFFSGMHTAYITLPNTIGFGDFTIMGEEFQDSGGPAYVVAIHISYIESSSTHPMYVHHYCSTIDSTLTTNAGGKYKEALDMLFKFHYSNPGAYDSTLGLKEFENTYKINHFPGLGIVKEMSMKHHIETICNFI